MEKWQKEWQIFKISETKQCFPTINHRLKIHKALKSELTIMLAEYGRLKAYYHRFKIIEGLTCNC